MTSCTNLLDMDFDAALALGALAPPMARAAQQGKPRKGNLCASALTVTGLPCPSFVEPVARDCTVAGSLSWALIQDLTVKKPLFTKKHASDHLKNVTRFATGKRQTEETESLRI